MNHPSTPIVAIVGASHKAERYSHLAVQQYLDAGYIVYPVHPSGIEVAGHKTYSSLSEIPQTPDIISMYVNPQLGLKMIADIVACKPRYVWLNPGADSDELEHALQDADQQPVRSCNLVALSLGNPLDIAERIRSEG